MKVHFLVCGTQKGGTTALYEYLREHPGICMANPKELHFFDEDDMFRTKPPRYDVYNKAFSPTDSSQILGEATPIYMYWEPAPRRIWEYNPAMKLIVLLRNPIGRAYSQWNMNRIRGDESLCFLEALLAESARCAKSKDLQHRLFSYAGRGFYLKQLERLWRYFPRSQVLTLRSEDLDTKPNETLGQIWSFLGLAPITCAVKHGVHALSYPAVMEEEARSYLTELFRKEVRDLEQALDWDLSNWIAHDR